MTKIPSVDEIIAAVEADDLIGFCLACGDEVRPVEPDGRNQECEACGERRVFGADELLLMVVA